MQQNEQLGSLTLHSPDHATPAASRTALLTGLAFWRAASTAIVLLFVLAPAAPAIPSPDVVISLFASAAQVLGVTTVILGRWFFVRRGQGRSGLRAQVRTSPFRSS